MILGEGDVVGGRYRVVGSPLEGGTSDVYPGVDQWLDRRVAIKVLRGFWDSDAAAAARHELHALRLVQLPGVVQVLDLVREGALDALILAWVEGAPFPGLAVPASWDALRPRLVGLLLALHRVHERRLWHRDLKPGNALVDAAGRVVLLDFGLAAGRALRSEPEDDGVSGTLRFIAPEVLLGAAEPSPSGDLFAVGVMAWEALAGAAPWEAPNPWALRGAYARSTAPQWPAGGPTVPGDAQAWLERMVALDPAARPGSAADAAAQIDDRGSPLDGLARVECQNGIFSESALQALFGGPELAHQLRSGAARALWARTGGERGRVEAELAAWELAGLATRQGGRLVVRRPALERLEVVGAPLAGGGAPSETEALVRAGRLVEAAARARAQARALADEGRLEAARSLLEASLAWAREEGDVAGEAEGLRALALAALGLGAVGPLEAARNELGRAESPPFGLATLLDAALMASRQQAATALDLLELLDVSDDLPLMIRRQLQRAAAAMRVSVERYAAVIADVSQWAAADGGDEARGVAAQLRGWLAYQAERPEDAVVEQQAALALRRDPQGRLSVCLSLASALLGAGRAAEAVEAAEDAAGLAARLRDPLSAVRAAWMARQARLALGDAGGVDGELVAAADWLEDRFLGGLVRLTEATAAWRAGDDAAAAALATAAAAALLKGRLWEQATLAQALAWRCGDRDPGAREGLLAAALSGGRAGLAAQALTLLCLGGEPAPPEAREVALAAVDGVADDRLLDLLTAGEVRAALCNLAGGSSQRRP